MNARDTGAASPLMKPDIRRAAGTMAEMHEDEANREYRNTSSGRAVMNPDPVEPRVPQAVRWGRVLVLSLGTAATIAVFGMGFPAMIAAPLLFAWLRVRHGTAGTLSALGLSIPAAAALGSLEGVAAALAWGATGTLLGWGYERGWRPSGVIGVSAVPLALLSALQAAVLVRPDARATFLSELGKAIDETAVLPSLFATRPEDLEAARRMALRAGEVLWLVTPAVGLISAVVLCFALYRIGQWLFARFGVRLGPVAPFGNWALPERFIWVAAGGLVLEISRIPPAMAVGHNLLLIAVFAYMVQGASILRHFLMSRRMSKTGQALVWIAGVLVLQPASGMLAVAAGLLDTWVDFRARLDSPSLNKNL
jgi:hypothetical protein